MSDREIKYIIFSVMADEHGIDVQLSKNSNTPDEIRTYLDRVLH